MKESDSEEEEFQMENIQLDVLLPKIVYRKGDAEHLIQTLTWFTTAPVHEKEGPYTEDLHRDGSLQDYTHFGSKDAALKEWMWTQKSAMDRMRTSSVPAHSKAYGWLTDHTVGAPFRWELPHLIARMPGTAGPQLYVPAGFKLPSLSRQMELSGATWIPTAKKDLQMPKDVFNGLLEKCVHWQYEDHLLFTLNNMELRDCC